MAMPPVPLLTRPPSTLHPLVLRRVLAAQVLLSTTGLSLATIARMLGYSDQSHFGRQFKAGCGQTPRAYRLTTAPCPVRASPGLPHETLRRVLAYMAAHLDRDLTWAELGAVAHQSPDHFARGFCASMSATPGAYLRQERLSLAQTLLSTTDLSLVTIALMLGYSDQSHFGQAFKQGCGQTPGAYRRLGRSC